MKNIYKSEINKAIIEILSKKNEIDNQIKKLKFQKKDSLTIMLFINAIMILIFSVGMVGMVTSALIAIPKALSILMPIFLTISGVNTIYRLRKIIKTNKEIKSCIEQKNFLNKTVEELEQIQRKPKIKIDNVKNIKNWKRKYALTKEYVKYKKMFIKEYKKGTLASTLKNSYYTVSEMRYLFNKTEEEYLEKSDPKKLLRKINKRKKIL